MRWLAPLLLFAAFVLGAAAPARADDRGAAAGSQVIALLPLAADARLAIYGQPVSSEVARALELQGFAIVVVTSTAPVPSRARLVIDGRIVRGDGDTVLLEARVRDPSNSTILAALSASAPALTRIDEAAAELAARLGPILHAGLAGRGAAGQAIARGHDGAVDGRPDPREPLAEAWPVAVVRVSSQVAPGPDELALDPLLRAGAVRLAGMVGHRADPAGGGATAALPPGAVAVEIALLAIAYDDRGVITARARARVRVVDAAGTVFDRVVRTDTLVGGRGDRRDAVARAAIDQIVDIAMPRVREQLAARQERR